jgi:ankyrin repeat protein
MQASNALWLDVNGVPEFDLGGIITMNTVPSTTRYCPEEGGALWALNGILMGGWPVSAVDDRNATVLHYAVIRGMSKVVKRLLLHKIDTSVRDMHGMTAIMYAAGLGNVEIMEMIAKNTGIPLTSDWNRLYTKQWNMLTAAVSSNKLQMVKHLLAAGLDRCARDASGLTPLHHAVMHGFYECARVLVQRGDANLVNMKSVDGNTALHLALSCTPVLQEMANLLLNTGASTSMQNGSGKTPLHMVTSVKTMELILERPDFNWNDLRVRDSQGRTPLMNAVHANNTSLSMLLIHTYRRHHWCLDDVDIYGNTVLHYVAAHDCSWMVRLLLQYNASVSIKNQQGYTVPHLVRDEVAPYLHASMTPKCERHLYRSSIKYLEDQEEKESSHDISYTDWSHRKRSAEQLREVDPQSYETRPYTAPRMAADRRGANQRQRLAEGPIL